MLSELGLTTLRVTARCVPTGLGYRLGGLGGTIYHRLAPAKREAVAANLSMVTRWRSDGPNGPVLEALTRRTFESHGVLLFEWLREADDVVLDFDGLEHLEDACCAGRGAVIATCHLGNWEIAALHLARRGFRLNVVTGEQLGRLGKAVRRRKARLGINVIRPPDGMRQLYRALGRGEVVALLIDGDIYQRGEPAPFFSHLARIPFGAARLSKATGAALLPAAMTRTGRSAYRIHIGAPIPPALTVDAMMQAVLQALEPLIAAHPHQWCLFRSLWNDRPGRRAG